MSWSAHIRQRIFPALRDTERNEAPSSRGAVALLGGISQFFLRHGRKTERLWPDLVSVKDFVQWPFSDSEPLCGCCDLSVRRMRTVCCWPRGDGDSQLPGKVDSKPSLHLIGAGRASQRTSWDCQPQPGLRDAPSSRASPRSEEGQLAGFVPEVGPTVGEFCSWLRPPGQIRNGGGRERR